MLTNDIAANDLMRRLLPVLFTRAVSLRGIAAALLLGASLIFLGSPAFAQQRVVVEKATGNVVDVGDSTLQYDTRYFDHMDFPASPIPTGENLRKYRRDASGAIVLRPKDELSVSVRLCLFDFCTAVPAEERTQRHHQAIPISK